MRKGGIANKFLIKFYFLQYYVIVYGKFSIGKENVFMTQLDFLINNNLPQSDIIRFLYYLCFVSRVLLECGCLNKLTMAFVKLCHRNNELI